MSKRFRNLPLTATTTLAVAGGVHAGELVRDVQDTVRNRLISPAPITVNPQDDRVGRQDDRARPIALITCAALAAILATLAVASETVWLMAADHVGQVIDARVVMDRR
jgi:hypothetical protein